MTTVECTSLLCISGRRMTGEGRTWFQKGGGGEIKVERADAQPLLQKARTIAPLSVHYFNPH